MPVSVSAVVVAWRAGERAGACLRRLAEVAPATRRVLVDNEAGAGAGGAVPDGTEVDAFLAAEKPDYLFIAAAKVCGIQANNQYRADFIYQNLMIEANLIHGAHLARVQRLMLLGSSCIYPRDCPQPIRDAAASRNVVGSERSQTNAS